MVFNVVAANNDDHSKNFSFLMNRNGEWHLSPAYDVTYPPLKEVGASCSMTLTDQA